MKKTNRKIFLITVIFSLMFLVIIVRLFKLQIIDDEKQVTVVSMSTLSKDFSSLKNKVNKDAAKQLGQKLAEKAKAAGVVKVVFDRNGFLYHGKIKSFADSARENGLEF